jgi:hypothetical protein
VELTDRVTCALRLLPTATVDAILIDHGPDAGPRPAGLDLDLTVRLAELPRAAEALHGLVTAFEALDHPGSGRLWTVETALRALDVIDLLGVPEADDENGVWPVWETMSRVATQALVEIPDPVRISGGSAFRVAVVVIANPLQDKADRLSAGRLGDLVAGWPVPSDDQADVRDTTMGLRGERARRTGGHRGWRSAKGSTEGTAGATSFRSEDSALVVDLDLTALIRIGPADASTKVIAARLGVPGHRA